MVVRWVLFIASVVAAEQQTKSTEAIGGPVAADALRLSGLFVSHGSLEPSFSPEVFSYSLHLPHAQDRISVAPEVDQSAFLSHESGDAPDSSSALPLVSFTWPGHEGVPPAVALGAREDVELPDQSGRSSSSGGSTFPISVTLFTPDGSATGPTYTVIVKISEEPLVVLRQLEATDSATHNLLVVEPPISTVAAIYKLYPSPEADSVHLKLVCAAGNTLKVEETVYRSHEVSLTLKREKDHHLQAVSVSCFQGDVYNNYVLTFASEWPKDRIQPPELLVEGRAKNCIFRRTGDRDAKAGGRSGTADEDYQKDGDNTEGAAPPSEENDEQPHEGSFLCPDPKSDDYLTRVIPKLESSIRYTLESNDKSVQIRLLNATPSLPFTYSGFGKKFKVVAKAGSRTMTWPLQFTGTPTPGILSFLGWMLGTKLVVLLLTLLSVLGLGNICGVGCPIGVTDIATAMTLLLQFLSFASAVRGDTPIVNLCAPFKWVTLFWPLPGSSHAGVRTSWGDSTVLENAYGCLVWSGIILAGEMIVHGIVAAKIRLTNRGNATMPHHLKFGNWESRTLHWLTFPAATAVGNILSSDASSVGWIAVASGVLCLVLIWVIAVFVTVLSAVKARRALWIWQSSVREEGALSADEDSGYWCDAICDQLLTHPVNKSSSAWLRAVIPWRWVAVVADVVPVAVYAGDLQRLTQPLFGPNEFEGRPHRETEYPLAKNPRSVEVIRAVSPRQCKCCPGTRLIAGLLRTRWLDVLFTYDGLTSFYHKGLTGGSLVVPLTVKTDQLSGPVTGGANNFFFDGVRMPFVRIGDAMFRLVVGLCLGAALSAGSYRRDSLVFGVVASLSLLMLVYIAVGSPYSRRGENIILGLLFTAITLTSMAFGGYAAAKRRPSVLADIALWVTAAVLCVLSLYACLVLVSIYSAIFCPPLEEVSFLERLANCTLVLADHAASWKTTLPAYNKKGMRDLRAQCSSSGKKFNVTLYPSGGDKSLEFTPTEIASVCKDPGCLPTPVLSFSVDCQHDTLKYRHVNLYDINNMRTELFHFLSVDRNLRDKADAIALNVAQQIASRGGNNIVHSVKLLTSQPLEGGYHDDEDSKSGSFAAIEGRRSTDVSASNSPAAPLAAARRRRGGVDNSLELTPLR